MRALTNEPTPCRGPVRDDPQSGRRVRIMEETVMSRIDYRTVGKEGYQLLGQLSQLAKKSKLGFTLMELVKLRASQINHCAYCVNMHANLLRKEGESEERLQNVVVWEEATCFTPREKAAFAWAESVTLVADTGVPNEVYEEVREH